MSMLRPVRATEQPQHDVTHVPIYCLVRKLRGLSEELLDVIPSYELDNTEYRLGALRRSVLEISRSYLGNYRSGPIY